MNGNRSVGEALAGGQSGIRMSRDGGRVEGQGGGKDNWADVGVVLSGWRWGDANRNSVTVIEVGGRKTKIGRVFR